MGALASMRVLDLTQYEAGPSGTQALAMMGADVVKVERPETGDPGRHTPVVGPAYFVNWNCNKRSVALDVGTPEGRELLLEMVPSFDVVAENLGPGVVEKLRIGYDDLRVVHPEVIYASVKGFGLSGPYSGYKCFDAVAQAMAGAFSVTGEPDGPPMYPGPTTGDSGTGMHLALAITAAYVQKLETGRGQRVEVSMQEAMTYYMRTKIAFSDFGRQPAERLGTGLNVLMDLYPCKPFGSNDYVYIMALPTMFEAVCKAIERPDLAADPRYTDEVLVTYEPQLVDAITTWAAGRTKHDAMRALGEAGVPAGAVLDTKDLHTDPHLVERGFVHTLDHPELGPVQVLGWPGRLSLSEVPVERPPLLGEHTDEVLESIGVDAERRAALRAQGALA